MESTVKEILKHFYFYGVGCAFFVAISSMSADGKSTSGVFVAAAICSTASWGFVIAEKMERE